MRLINVTNLKIEEYFGTDIPEYAIVSHTWDATEANFQQWTNRVARLRKSKLPGYAKVYKACKLARQEGFRYLWIDTVCIDKSSSSELSEAINSMYAWYENAKVCYVYLSDVRISSKENNMDVLSLFRTSRWWSRGWTLQELLAPDNVIFYTREWVKMGTKYALAVLIQEITGIDEGYLRGIRRISMCSIAQRMSWASKRVTTRDEDLAYSLLGIFGINMPLLYGEGSQNSFRRLQEEIIKVSIDQSIFAFDTGSSDNTLLAHHPRDFAAQCRVRPSFARKLTLPFTLSNAGLSLKTPLIQTLSPYWVLAVLNCVELHWAQEDVKARSIICLPLLGRDKKYMRARAPVALISLGADTVGQTKTPSAKTRYDKNIADTQTVGKDSDTSTPENASSIVKTMALEIQDLTTRNDTEILVSYFSRIYPLYGNEMDEAMKGFAVSEMMLDSNTTAPEQGFMLTFPRGMGEYRCLLSHPSTDLYRNISFFLPSASAVPVSEVDGRPHPRHNTLPGQVTRGLLVFAHSAIGPRMRSITFGDNMGLVGIYLALDSVTGNWTCRIIDLGIKISITASDLEGKARIGDAMVLGKPEEWVHYDQAQNVVVAARTRFETVKGKPCKEAIMVEIVFDVKELVEERDLE
ncbi:heterokaryon incompatibility protein-domain-containing protein [Triangularia verruculosa]|uniref:Heterokaryon incompatibility protein-domain-containing protein n=1 Tax=Triangularia verruculosa TaxID=2587418 RepID=A0AAN7B1N1_9PEZI|nr:heterokaryon incompatibility protein-domain-containing protein [Triangularia verruculosa]